MKRAYMKPAMRVVRIQHSGFICTSGYGVTSVQTGGFDDPDDDFIWGGGNNTGAR